MKGAEKLWYGSGPGWGLLRSLLAPLGWLFGLAVGIRAFLYDSGLFASRRVGAPVVSVGNIGVGGSGKTPLVIWLVEALQAKGVKVAVVSRGYAGKGVGVRVVDGSPGGGAADEALLVSLRTACGVVTGADRVAACELAIRRFSPDLIILDDGFQHRRLARDLDIVLSPVEPWPRGLLPAGPLREPWSALSRADVVVPSPLVRAAGLVNDCRRDAEELPLDRLSGVKVSAVAGIARPGRFFSLLRDCGAKLVGENVFPDHHCYTAADWRRVAAKSRDAELVVTTEKDLVKLKSLACDGPPLLALRLALEVEGGGRLLELVSALDARATGHHHLSATPERTA